MDASLRDSYSIALVGLSEEEAALEAQAVEMDSGFSGLKDLDVLLRLARAKLSLCILLMERVASLTDARERERLKTRVTEKALDAFGIVEGLLSENVSEDQKDAVSRDPSFSPLKEKLEEFLMKGGGGFLEVRELDEKRGRALSRGIVESIRKYAGEDDRYPPLELEKYPAFVRRILLALFPVFVKEHPQSPPYGIEEGEEVTYSSKNMKLPVSQAIFYMENELLPELQKLLEESPGDRRLQGRISELTVRIDDYKKLRFFPRSTPVLLEKGYYTEGLTSYTSDGEMLVPIPLSVTARSGTNLDRKMELVRSDLVRRLAGRGICPELDLEYERLKKLESGLRGSSRAASWKLDVKQGFLALKREFPALARLESKEGFKELAALAARGNIGASARRVSAFLAAENQTRAGIPDATGISRTSPS